MSGSRLHGSAVSPRRRALFSRTLGQPVELRRVDLRRRFILLPLVWLAVASFEPNTAAYSSPPVIHIRASLSNYDALAGAGFLSAWQVGHNHGGAPTTSHTGPCDTSRVMRWARFAFFGRRILMSWLVFVYVIPALIWFIPICRFDGVAWLLFRVAVGVPDWLPPRRHFLMAGYFARLPQSIEESALIDGAGPWRTLVSILVPTVWPAIATVATLICTATGGGFFAALLIFTNQNTQTLPARSAA